MMTALFTAAALLPGYIVAVAFLMVTTLGIGAKSPAFVMKDHRIRKRYKLTLDIVWLFCTMIGGYITAAVTTVIGGMARPWLPCAALVAVMILVLWTNSWEMRQRGFFHQVLMSVVSVAGVTLGYLLETLTRHR
jgi:hypothetical protein